ncbi:hypothetical protein JHK87_000669 [Glycine soja]|nr:hypothetical protein JHK87_000669 [Glycine soja]
MGKHVSREHFQPRACSGKKENLKHTVFIDVDDQVDDVDVDVTIIDYEEFMSKLHGSSAPSTDRVCTPQSVISIDDDDSDDESDDAEIPGVVAGGVGELDSDACSSERSSPDPSGMRNSVHVDVDDDSGVCEKVTESDKLKSRKASSANGIGGCRHGIDWGDSESSESDCSDCELMDREQWEKISLKRKRSAFNDQPCYDEHGSSSGLHCNNNVYVDVDEENMTEENAGGPAYSGPTHGEYVKENQSSFSVRGDSQVDNQSSFPVKGDSQVENFFMDSDEKAEWETFKSSLFESTEEMKSLHQSSDIEHGRSTRSKDFSTYTQYNNNYNFCRAVTGVSRSQEACERQFSNTGSTLKSNLFDLNSECASDDEGQVNCDGLASSDQDCGLIASNDQDCGLTASNEKDIINEREKLKETDEYKQAMEEEWASRQRQLQIQVLIYDNLGGEPFQSNPSIYALRCIGPSNAEEAQRLRKRRKAEKRLLDMQRRQKERIEEVRETQKKDEEVMNLKEQLRVEIQKGLNQLEMRCHDMPSLLRGLGIQVGGSFIPLPNEASCVHAAYKRALLKFHPDRASKTDVRAQVEAEEKFKLISRWKEKFAMTSCH